MFSNGCSIPLVASIDGGGNNGNNGMNGWGGDWIWIILVFALIWGNGFGGYGNGNGGGSIQPALTRGDLCMDMNFSDLEGSVRGLQQSVSDGFHGIDNAVCQLGYQNSQLINNVQMQVANGFNTLDTNLCQLGNNISNQMNTMNIANMQNANALQSQLAQCCCDTRAGLKDIQFQNAQDTCATTTAIANAARDIVDNQNANYRALHDEIVANRIEDKNAQIAAQNQQIFQLQLAASQEAQNNYIVNQLKPCPIPAYITCNPWGNTYGFAGYNNNGYGNGCGCAA